jgi:hypothetical protein
MSDGAAFRMLPRSDGAADHCSIGAGEGATAAETLVACARSAAGRLNSNPDEPEPPFSKRLTSLKLSEDRHSIGVDTYPRRYFNW